MPSVIEAQYDEFAGSYDSAVDLPCCVLEGELVSRALGDCTGLTVLDLGGGSGIHARRAIEAGAALIDVFDISSEMLRVGQEAELKAGRKDRIRWFQADATQPFAEQVEHGIFPVDGYDIVMANWTIDNAASAPELLGMWENAVDRLKPGGRFLGMRLQNIHAGYLTTGKYGTKHIDFENIHGGMKYKVQCLINPPFSWECVAMSSTYPLTNSIPKTLGLGDFQVMQAKETDTVGKDGKYWCDFVEDPSFVMVTARKL
ncbi:hypothetical protein V492_03531 [Pseudogymnoascus sp. VKM F-4246]|nr:hypothetical protein V492_03531 [Pseudogymnoascus sp. VKM F-4246]